MWLLKDIASRFNLTRFAVFESTAVSVLGLVLFAISLLLLLPIILASVNGDDTNPFFIPLIIGIILSLLSVTFVKRSDAVSPADGIFTMLVLWTGMFFFGTLPYMLSGMDFIDSLFESVSGFATVGATVISDVNQYSMALILWRSITNWIGGMVIVTMFMFILPMFLRGSRNMVKSEMFGARSGNFVAKLGSVAKQFIWVYVILTVIFTIMFLLCGLPIYDSMILSMGSISIGGFTCTNDSIASYSLAVKLVMILIMIISASNFYLHFKAVVRRDFSGYKHNDEFKFMIVWFTLVSILFLGRLVSSGAWDMMGGNTVDRVTDIVFQVVSMGTTAGYWTLDYSGTWSVVGASAIILLMFIGGSSGSTAGGIKISRAIIMVKFIVKEIRYEVHPNAVYEVKYEGQSMDKGAVRSAVVVVLAYLFTALLCTFVFDRFIFASDTSMDESIYTSIALLSGTGTTIGEFFNGYGGLPGWAKIFACIMMFLGRLEIVSLLAIFTLDFWKELLGPRQIKKIKNKIATPGKYVVAKVQDRNSVPDEEKPKKRRLRYKKHKKDDTPKE